MPHRSFTTRNQPQSSVTPLRRSPRLLTKELPPPDYPKTPDPQSEKTHKRFPELKSGSNRSVCLRRSPRFSGNTNTTTDQFDGKKSFGEANRKGSLDVGKDEMGINGSAETVARSEKRVTRGSIRGIKRSKQVEIVKKTTEEELPVVGSTKLGFHPCKGVGAKSEKRVTRSSSRSINERKEVENVEKITKEGLPVAENAKVGTNASKQFGHKLEKRTTRSSATKTSNGNGVVWSSCNVIVNEEGFLDVERAKVGGNLCEELGSKLEKRAIAGCGASLELVREKNKAGDLDRGVKEIGVKRKRNHQFEEGHGVVKGWTKDQEMALQRAYYSAKPTPLFWKKVAKLVPGKSAKDCFNKIHSDHSTPPQPPTRLRSRKKDSPSFSLPSCTLLKPEEPITKKPSRRKQSHHLAQKTVRQLLQKHYHVDQNYEADLFSVLESTMKPSTQALQEAITQSTPGGEQDSGYLKKCRDRSSSAHHTKHKSRLSGSYGATLMSPPVLKPVKNKALHEKYIDRLHCREAKRQAAKDIRGKENRKESCINILKTDVIRAAKNALVFDAKDAIHQFHQVTVSGTGSLSDFDYDFVESDDYEVETEL